LDEPFHISREHARQASFRKAFLGSLAQAGPPSGIGRSGSGGIILSPAHTDSFVWFAYV
jgi:hypothetical protein